MLICKIFLRKSIHEVTTTITFDCQDNYSDIQQNSTCKAGSAQKRNMHVELARLHLQQFLFHQSVAKVSLKRKTNSILHHHTAYDHRKGSKSHLYTTARCWYTTKKPFVPKMFTNPGILLTNVAVYDKPNWTHHFQVARHFGIRHSTIGSLCSRQCNRYVLL